MPGALPTMKLGDLLGEAGQGGVLLFAVRLEDLAASSRSKRSDMPSSDVVSGPRILNSYPYLLRWWRQAVLRLDLEF